MSADRRVMEFRKWPSIENTYKQQHIDWWLLRHPRLAKAKYWLTEKLHGSNVQIHVEPDGAVSYGTRGGFVNGPALFGWPASRLDVIPRFTELVAKMIVTAQWYETDITLYGEIVGPGVPSAQKGIYYGDAKRVYFFGSRIGDILRSPMVIADDFPMIDTVPLVGTVTGLDAALSFDIEFSSKLVEVEDNICEGIVIQPLMPVRNGDSYFLLKKKNEKFAERAHAKKERVPDEVADPLNAAFRTYITPARMQSVFSKDGPIEDRKEIGRYIKAILADAKEDFLKDYPEAATLDKAQQKTVFNVGSMIAKMLMAEM